MQHRKELCHQTALGDPHDPRTRRLLEVAAVRGVVFDERTVRGVLDAPVDETVDAFDRATAAGIVREDAAGSYAFVHALMRQCVLDGVSKTRAARLHWRIAEQLERDNGARGDAQEIAYHYSSGADVGDDATIVRTSLHAGDEAYGRLAFDEAATHLRRALSRLERAEPDSDLRYRILALLGHTLNALSDAQSRRPIWLDAIALARAQRDPERLFGALMGYRYVSHLTLDIDLGPMIDEVLSLLEPADSPVRALALALRAVPILRNDLARSPNADPKMADEAVNMARRTGDHVARVSTLRARLALRAEYPDLQATTSDAEELAGLLPAADGISRDSSAVLRELTRAMVRVGRRTEAEHYLTLADQEAARNGLPLATPLNLLLRSALAVARGQLDEGMRLSNEVGRYAGPNQALCQLLHAAQRLAIHMERGKLESVIRATTYVDVPFTAQRWAAVRAGALADAGRHDEASAELRSLIDSSAHTSGYATSLVIRYRPEICRQLGDTTSAAALLADVTNWSEQILVVATGVSIEGAADRSIGHLLATLGQLDEADVAYDAAASLERSAGFPALLARTEYWHARALLERGAGGDHERAKQLLHQSIELTAELGLTLLHRQASELATTLSSAPTP
jgi:tetratricopeptide (TPR) repeat protein